MASYAALALIFLIFWAITQKWKLPKYTTRLEDRFGSSLIENADDLQHNHNDSERPFGYSTEPNSRKSIQMQDNHSSDETISPRHEDSVGPYQDTGR